VREVKKNNKTSRISIKVRFASNVEGKRRKKSSP